MHGNDIDRPADFSYAVFGFYRRPPVGQFIVPRPTDPLRSSAPTSPNA